MSDLVVANLAIRHIRMSTAFHAGRSLSRLMVTGRPQASPGLTVLISLAERILSHGTTVGTTTFDIAFQIHRKSSAGTTRLSFLLTANSSRTRPFSVAVLSDLVILKAAVVAHEY
jgi:hypothetical protein